MKERQLKKTVKEIEEFGKYFQDGHSIEETAKKFNVPYGSMKSYLTKFGYRKPIRTVKKNKKQNLDNPNYFENIDTHEKAYFLGLLLSDGSISKNTYSISLGLTLQLQDKYILEKFQKEIGGTTIISEYKNSAKITISNDKIVSDLINLGMYENKSNLDYKIPEINNKFLNSFILGYFDGDGCITIKSSGAIVVSICGNSKVFLEDLKEKLKLFDIDTRLDEDQGKRKNPFYVLYLKGRENQLKFKEIMYKDCSCYLLRKYEKFMRIPC